MHIRQILSAKGSDVVVISPDASIGQLIALLRDHNLGAVVVSADGRSVDGIVSERDVIRSLTDSTDLLSSPVTEIMTTDVHTCGPNDTVETLAARMTDLRIRHLPVVDDHGLAGIVSIGDIVKSHITQLQFERDQLEGYVTR